LQRAIASYQHIETGGRCRFEKVAVFQTSKSGVGRRARFMSNEMMPQGVGHILVKQHLHEVN
jgi:hypothetical protein